MSEPLTAPPTAPSGECFDRTIAGIAVPDTDLVRAATALVREAADDTVFHHSRRVYLWGMLQLAAQGRTADPELAYVGAMFHDLGLTPAYRTSDRRFEIDGAEAAYGFLRDHGRSPEDARAAWLAVALHTTPEVPHHLAPEVTVVTLGVETDVLGLRLDRIEPGPRAEVLAAHPRPDFKNRILRAFYEGMASRPATTFGTMNDDVLAHFDPAFRRVDFVRVIQENAWPE
ncbi:HD domain-containing protein [Promicromonospora thailandica]|uniref:HD domain-containing protein n=1 Tax=Promicromonospora thailandica TaxID=765201 RepID=A0A9X2JXS9_9MICO|nr:HD domain-containing protein [Promicromonospora thailandica]MCP2266553.1 HD domain-containing protein [Promicromonospora thailandica]BFF17373.1 HD domain-containing protein [Promicromonospora thailandica]